MELTDIYIRHRVNRMEYPMEGLAMVQEKPPRETHSRSSWLSSSNKEQLQVREVSEQMEREDRLARTEIRLLASLEDSQDYSGDWATFLQILLA